MIPFDQPLLFLLAVVTAIAGVGRLARVITYDEFPPSMWVRNTWAKITKGGSWMKLFFCFWCLTPWIMLVSMAWFIAGYLWNVDGLIVSWWLFWGWLGLSYLSSMLVARDEPQNGD